ncbi:hypothetical protein ACFSTA_03575 [Ornithinibacillus salinisoli]|uniref:Uncharacterized protein n=1 Tax=Ornithinibacillus salinisoli TaxID=1848459 RepID=A0ABW4VXM8_9BACI
MDKKLHYRFGIISYIITILHLILGDYAGEERISGILFFSFAIITYISFVYLFFRYESGKVIVIFGLILIACISISLTYLS